ncbi:unnamed protein product, partial [Pocillopora meandrina]
QVDEGTWKLKTHLTGVLVNQKQEAHAFLDLCEYPHDSNLTINVMLETLLHIKRLVSLADGPQVAFTQSLTLVCIFTKIVVLRFLSLLVEGKIFEKIKISFLVVGHTHENIDQMFSCVARRLAKNDAHTLEALKEQIKVSYTPPNSINNISGHVHQHVFKIQNNNGNSKLFYKKWSTSPVWLPDGGISLISTIPRGVPKLVKPNTLGGMSLDKLEMDLPKYAMKLKDSEMVWWREFITRQRNRHQQ